MSANKFHTRVGFYSFQFAQQDHSDLSGADDVRASAGLTVEAFDFDGAENSFTVDLFANSRGGEFFGGAEPNVHRAVVENNLIGAALCGFQLALIRSWSREIDG